MCTKRINEVLQSPGGLANTANLQVFYNLSTEKIDLEANEKRLRIEKGQVAELEKQAWDAFTQRQVLFVFNFEFSPTAFWAGWLITVINYLVVLVVFSVFEQHTAKSSRTRKRSDN